MKINCKESLELKCNRQHCEYDKKINQVCLSILSTYHITSCFQFIRMCLVHFVFLFQSNHTGGFFFVSVSRPIFPTVSVPFFFIHIKVWMAEFTLAEMNCNYRLGMILIKPNLTSANPPITQEILLRYCILLYLFLIFLYLPKVQPLCLEICSSG